MGLSVVTFGEVMGRVAPPGFLRFSQALPGAVEITFAGAEANVAASLAMLGAQARFVTALPRNPIADACVRTLRGIGVDTSRIVRTAEGRLGLYFLETGANQRGSSVIYDRQGSSVMITPATAYDWTAIFQDADWLHVTGITPALGANAAAAALAAAQAAKSVGLGVSCDLNFRKKLWNWQPGTTPRDLAEQTMRGILPYVDLVVANEEDADLVLGIRAEGTDVQAGALDSAAYEGVAARIAGQFPNVSRVAITMRESISATHNKWGGMLYEALDRRVHFAPRDANGEYAPYEIKAIVDRVGAGDSFVAGLILALNTEGLSDPETALRFAVAASCLKHSISGDFNYVTRAEVDALMGGSASGRVSR